MRHRYRYSSKRQQFPVAKREKINDVQVRDALDKLDEISKHHRKVLRKMKPLKWDTKRDTFRSLRSILYWRMHWLKVRQQVVAVAKLAQEAYQKLRDQMGYVYPSTLLCVQNGIDVDVVQAAELAIHSPSVDTFTSINATIDRHNAILHELQIEYNQMHELLNLPPWRDISDHVCHGGRLAFSVVLAVSTGTLSRNKADQHKLFGWNISGTRHYGDDNHPIFRRVREVMRGMHPRIPATKGPRPSMLEGWDVCKKGDPYEVTKPQSKSRAMFVHICRTSKSKAVHDADQYLFSNRPSIEDSTPIMAGYVRTEVRRDGGKSLRIRNKIVRKIMQLRDATYLTGQIMEDGVMVPIEPRMVQPRQETSNTSETVFLGMPVHMGGDDYIVPAMWPGAPKLTSTGWVYLRRGWPDMFHQHIYDLLDHAPQWDEAYRWKTPYEKLPIIESLMPTPEHVHETLENASRTFFNRTRSKELKGLTQKQRYVRVLVKLRRLPCLTRNDSYGVSNCKPGTEDFINALAKVAGQPVIGDGTAIDGRRLAYYWYKAKYIQEDRFTNVVNKLYEPYQKELDAKAALDAALDQRILEAMESDGWNPAGGLVSTGNVAACILPYMPTQVTDESQIAQDGSFINLHPVQG